MPRGERIAKPAEGDPARPVFVFGAAGPCPKAARRSRAGGSMTAPPTGRLIPPLTFALLLACTADSDAPLVGPQAMSFANSEWSAPVNLGAPVNSAASEMNAALSPDELSLYFVSTRAGGVGGADIWVSRRASPDAPWGDPVNLGPNVNGPGIDASPAVSVDGHLLFFSSDRSGGHGSNDLYVARRTDKSDDLGWGPAVNLGPDVNTAGFEAGGFYLQSGEDGSRNLYFSRGPNSVALDIYVVAVTADGETRGPAVPVTELNDPDPAITDAHPSLRARPLVTACEHGGPAEYGGRRESADAFLRRSNTHLRFHASRRPGRERHLDVDPHTERALKRRSHENRSHPHAGPACLPRAAPGVRVAVPTGGAQARGHVIRRLRMVRACESGPRRQLVLQRAKRHARARWPQPLLLLEPARRVRAARHLGVTARLHRSGRRCVRLGSARDPGAGHQRL